MLRIQEVSINVITSHYYGWVCWLRLGSLSTAALTNSCIAANAAEYVACCLIACVDVGLTVSEKYSAVAHHHYARQSSSPVARTTTTVGYVAHLMGAAAGLAAGCLVLRRSTAHRPCTRPPRTFDISSWSAVACASVP